MRKLRTFKRAVRGLACLLICTTTLVCAVSNEGWAMLAPAVTAAQAGPHDVHRAADMKTIQTALESKIVKERLKQLGLNDAEIKLRIENLSDQEINQLAGQIDAINPGGDAGLLIGLLTVVVLVLLIVYLIKRV